MGANLPVPRLEHMTAAAVENHRRMWEVKTTWRIPEPTRRIDREPLPSEVNRRRKRA